MPVLESLVLLPLSVLSLHTRIINAHEDQPAHLMYVDHQGAAAVGCEWNSFQRFLLTVSSLPSHHPDFRARFSHELEWQEQPLRRTSLQLALVCTWACWTPSDHLALAWGWPQSRRVGSDLWGHYFVTAGAQIWVASSTVSLVGSVKELESRP